MELTRKTFIGEVKSVDEKNFTVTAVMSDESVDRYKEVILVDAWKKRLKDFMKHPVLLSSHDYYSGLMNQIGEWEKVWVDKDSKQLVGRAKYYVGKGNPEADWGFFLATQGIAAYSVGFISHGMETDEEKIAELMSDSKKKPRAVFTEAELLETSQVLLPANPAALQQDTYTGPEDDETEKTFGQMFVQKMADETFKKRALSYLNPEPPPEEKKEENPIVEEREWEAPVAELLATVQDLKENLHSADSKIAMLEGKIEALENALDATAVKELGLEDGKGTDYVDKLFEEQEEVNFKTILTELKDIKKVVFGT
jgi:hypothetical protein